MGYSFLLDWVLIHRTTLNIMQSYKF